MLLQVILPRKGAVLGHFFSTGEVLVRFEMVSIYTRRATEDTDAQPINLNNPASRRAIPPLDREMQCLLVPLPVIFAAKRVTAESALVSAPFKCRRLRQAISGSSSFPAGPTEPHLREWRGGSLVRAARYLRPCRGRRVTPIIAAYRRCSELKRAGRATTRPSGVQCVVLRHGLTKGVKGRVLRRA